ncbi:Transposase [Saccharicrinis carchari]|uniref:Transposase n=1 Tax=Saccharicrinis carchari TaxID=1168039 RepID=A0A521FHC6_SACCC|nr:transposase [Saccharicrinis carchari]SMO94960.1 Transposase [Saccharicrinis carchari]
MQEKMFMLMETWESGNLSPRLFCESHDIKEHVFYYWRKKYLKSKTSSTARFVPVSIENNAERDVPTVEIAYPNGTVVRLGNGASLSIVRSLIGLI